ncbi:MULTISPECIES: GntR family transcriptional regulator [Streptomyces violaceusniger group]|uniref:GntR family transcriptional regulator n=2 Tax=Streptomyces javensis TaxID=114698 RepID=A0ABN1WHK5_9ACTN|nr:GntR family transcriptional regulator [Streptomyces javensis]MBI0312304.1 GntR family transcriptional regulator [Streptomyces javensis]
MTEAAEEPTFITQALSRAMGLEGQGALVRRMVTVLATEIIEGTLPADYPLTSVEVGQRFKTSRTPVRQALGLLQREGLVAIEPRRRPRVASLTLPEIRDIYQIRASLYAVISRSIVQAAPDEAIARLHAPLRRMKLAVHTGDALDYFYGTVDFRWIEAEICPNRSVGPLIESLGLRTYRLRRFGLAVPGRTEISFRDYSRLVEAYEDRDADLAVAVGGSIMTKALQVIEKNWPAVDAP